MDSRYKIIVSGRNVYKEIELAPDAKEIKLGTDIRCDVRLHKSLFFEPIELDFFKDDQGWSVLCSDNIYLTVGDVRKLATKPLVHGDDLTVKYQSSDIEVFHIDFQVDFYNGLIKYERVIDLSNVNEFTLGAADNFNIVLKSAYVESDVIRAVKKGEALRLEVERSRYGVCHNGNRFEGSEEIRSYDFFSVSDFLFYYKGDELWTQIRGDMHINGLRYEDRPVPEQYPRFSRNTRLKSTLCEDAIEVLDPPSKPEKPKTNLLTRLLPSMGMLIASGVMAIFGGAMIAFGAISGAIAILTTLLTLRDDKKGFKKSSEDRIRKYTEYVGRKREEIEQCREDEKAALADVYISQEEEKARLDAFSPMLFDRRPEDEDFLCVNFGDGTVPARRKINYKKQERLEVEDELQLIPQQLDEEYKCIEQAPVTCDLKTLNAIGVTGGEAFRFDIFKNTVIDIAARHYFTDVKMAFVASEANADKITWLRMLPHTCDEMTQTHLLVTDTPSKNLVFEYLYKELTARAQGKKDPRRIVVFFYDECGFRTHPLSRFVDRAAELGVVFVFFGSAAADIPMGCGYIISEQDGGQGLLTPVGDSGGGVAFSYPHLSDSDAKKIAGLLAPVYSEEISLEGTLTKNITLFGMLNILAADDLDLEKRWAQSQVYKSMAAPIGVTTKGTLSLDLHDKADGPHGLVAGTTGSGKSELLQTYILSMSTLFHPYEVGFVIIDFKGGGMVNQFRDLPHLLGAITNIDGKEIDRSLRSIRAELQKRQRLFAEAEVNHIDKYIRKYKSGEVTTPLPHLILIVDEFAELKAQQPDFMKELISAARIGRSLGVHLILATQKPSGQVDDQIWSNSRFKLCLKVATSQDSNEMIKSPLAAEIREAGRAYLMLGENESLSLFQSAYSGGPARVVTSGEREFSIYEVRPSGERTLVYTQKRKKDTEEKTTQLDDIVEHIARYCKQTGLEKLPDICIQSLSDVIVCPDTPMEKTASFEIPLGIYDDPDNQYQDIASVRLGENNVLIVGASQMGKTNLLQVMIRQLAEAYTPEEVAIYIADFGAMSLNNFGELANVGGVVTASDEERFKNLLKLLDEEIEIRKQRLLDSGLGSFHLYREAGYTDLPFIVFMLDNFSVFKELYAEEYEGNLLHLIREGQTYGICTVLTSTQASGLSFRYLSSIGCRIALTCNDRAEYSEILDRCRTEPKNVPGRALFMKDKAIFEFQSYIVFDGEKGIDKVNAVRAFVKATNERYAGMRAKQIPSIPKTLSLSYIRQNHPNIDVAENIAIALDYSTIDCVMLNCYEQLVLALAGKNTAARAGFLHALMSDIRINLFQRPVKLYVVDNFRKELEKYKDLPYTDTYTISTDGLLGIIDSLYEELQSRFEKLEDEGVEALYKMPLLVAVINNRQALDAMAGSREHESQFEEICKMYSNLKVLFLVTDINDSSVNSFSPQILRKVKEDKKILCFGPLKELKIVDIYGSTVKGVGMLNSPDDAYFLNREDIYRVKTIQEV